MMGDVRRWVGDGIALAALCLLLGLSVSLRIIPTRGAAAGPDAVREAAAVDLGGGVVLPRGATAPRTVLIGACWTPIPVEFVQPSPHGTDASLAGLRNEGDQVFYAYHGWLLGGRFAATELTILHFIWRGASVLRLDGTAGRDTLAVKLVMPTDCEAAPEQAIAALRREVQMGR